MSITKEVELSLKVMINKQKSKVLFAEADCDFADLLLSFLTLPLGTIVRVLEKQYGDKAPVIGSLTTLYNGLLDLESDNFWTEGGKEMLLNPRNSFETECRQLKLNNIYDTQPTKYFRCGDRDCKRKRSPIVSMYYDTMKCDCGKSMSKAMGTIIESKITQVPDIDSDSDIDGGVFTEKGVMFLITDDLKMAPIVSGTIIQTLINLGITITDGAELRTVTLGFNDIMDLLRVSLLSNTPLTDLILHKGYIMNDVKGDLPLHMVEESNSKKMIVTAWAHKSTRKLMHVLAEDDFVDFLFSLLVIPLGGVECLLGGNTWLKNIDNLYRSIEECVSMPDMKRRLMKPELPPNYLSKNQVFSLSEQMNPTIYFFESVTASPDYTVEKGSWVRFKDPKGDHGSYVKGSETLFTIKDNLRVWHGESVSDTRDHVKELELHIGLEEALNILQASLTSNSALNDGLSNQILEKLTVQEH